MRIILPPSETKRSGGGSVFAPETLAHDAELSTARKAVRSALVRVSRNEEAAIKALKLGVKSRSERLHNLELDTSGAMPAVDRYTGVLYDALDASTLSPAAREWVETHVVIQSALFGMISAADHIPAYRLSASSRLPALKTPLSALWRTAHEAIDWAEAGWLLDLRSQDYVACAPLPAQQSAYLHVTQRTADGEVRALNHFNKGSKGALVREMAEAGVQCESADEFHKWAAIRGIETVVNHENGTVTLIRSV